MLLNTPNNTTDNVAGGLVYIAGRAKPMFEQNRDREPHEEADWHRRVFPLPEGHVVAQLIRAAKYLKVIVDNKLSWRDLIFERRNSFLRSSVYCTELMCGQMRWTEKCTDCGSSDCNVKQHSRSHPRVVQCQY